MTIHYFPAIIEHAKKGFGVFFPDISGCTSFGKTMEEAARVMVRADLPGRAVRLNISLDEALVEAIDATAQSRGMTRSGFLAEAAKRAIQG